MRAPAHLPVLLLAAAVLLLPAPRPACTTIIAAPGATIDGSALVTHNVDCLNCDFRLGKTPAFSAKERPPKTRNVYLYSPIYPRKVVEDRAKTWRKSELEGTEEQKEAWGAGNWSVKTGEVPEVGRRYGLIEADYGIMNEKGVAMGESTCYTRFGSLPRGVRDGKALFSIAELSMIGLERGGTAREAIQVMGDAAVKHGFYGEDYDDADLAMSGGETLAVIDPTEAWIFHVACDHTGASAVWAAQRLPHGHVTIVANQFIIREVHKNHPDFMHSENLWSVAELNHLWTPSDGPLDFVKVYAGEPDAVLGPYSSLRRWAVFRRLLPSLELPVHATPRSLEYPFSIEPAAKVSVRDFFELMRLQHENSPFDLTTGVASGPHGNPDRYDPFYYPGGETPDSVLKTGAFPRGISIHRTAYGSVSQARGDAPSVGIVWLAQHSPRTALYVPLFAEAGEVPEALRVGSHFKFEPRSFYWYSCMVSNWGKKFYRFAVGDILETQAAFEDQQQADLATAEKKATKLIKSGKRAAAIDVLQRFSETQAAKAVSTWSDLFYRLVARFHDGNIVVDTAAVKLDVRRMSYPQYWLNASGFFNPIKSAAAPPAEAPAAQEQRAAGGVVQAAQAVEAAVGAGVGEATATATGTPGGGFVSGVMVTVGVVAVWKMVEKRRKNAYVSI